MHPIAAAEGVTASVEATSGPRFSGAAILRERPHPVTGQEALQLGVPDAALGFRPRRGERYQIRIEQGGEAARSYEAGEVWLERVQSSWWFILAPAALGGAPAA